MIREGLRGFHTEAVVGLLRRGYLWFIFREVTFFFRIFWFLFDRALSPSIELGAVWVPLGINPIRPFGLPLLNRAILLRSAVSLRWSHHSLLIGGESKSGLIMTLFLGIYFLAFQGREYLESSFTIRDSSYGRVFYFSTGFHGLHVALGALILSTSLARFGLNHYRSTHHEGYQFAILYWHFVDVV